MKKTNKSEEFSVEEELKILIKNQLSLFDKLTQAVQFLLENSIPEKDFDLSEAFKERSKLVGQIFSLNSVIKKKVQLTLSRGKVPDRSLINLWQEEIKTRSGQLLLFDQEILQNLERQKKQTTQEISFLNSRKEMLKRYHLSDVKK